MTAEGGDTAVLPVAVTGATGRMGRTVVETAADRPDVEVAAAVNRDPATGEVAGVPVAPATELSTLLSARSVAAVVDFTGPASAAKYAGLAADAGVAFVTGTTGFEDREALERAARRVPVVHARNFAPGAAVLRGLLAEAAAALPSYDVELVETHHGEKRDAPSGTALDLVGVVADARPEADLSQTHGRSGATPREPGEVGVHAVRAGRVTGEHTALLAGHDEQVRIEHRVGDRTAFVAGALRAVEAVADREPGLYGPEVVR